MHSFYSILYRTLPSQWERERLPKSLSLCNDCLLLDAMPPVHSLPCFSEHMPDLTPKSHICPYLPTGIPRDHGYMPPLWALPQTVCKHQQSGKESLNIPERIEARCGICKEGGIWVCMTKFLYWTYSQELNIISLFLFKFLLKTSIHH